MCECLPLKAEDASMRKRLSGHDTSIIYEELHREIIRPIDYEIILFNDVKGIVGTQELLVCVYFHIRIDQLYLFAGRIHFGPVCIGSKVDNLTLQVTDIYHIPIHDTDCSHSGCCQIESNRSTKSSCPDNQDFTLLDFFLSFHAHILQQNVPAITFQFFLCEIIHTPVLHP